MTKIYHPAHGYVFSGDDAEIAKFLETGGKIVVKVKDAHETTKPKVEALQAARTLSRNTAKILEHGTN